jgi:hypothetical protein
MGFRVYQRYGFFAIGMPGVSDSISGNSPSHSAVDRTTKEPRRRTPQWGVTIP